MNADLIGVWLEKLFTGMLLLSDLVYHVPVFRVSIFQWKSLFWFVYRFTLSQLNSLNVDYLNMSWCQMHPYRYVSIYIYIYIYILSPQHAHLSIHPPFCVFVWPYMNHRLHVFIYLVIHPSISLPLRHSWRPHSVFFPQSCSRRSRFLSLLACFNGLLKSSVDDLTKNGCFLIFLQRLIDTLSIRIISEAIQ